MDLYHPSGEMSVRLMILALLPGPLTDALGPNRFLRGWLAIRRNLGVAAFLYALLHLVFYVLDMQLVSAMVDELAIPGIWTGWKQLQRLVYPAFLLALIHWLLLDWAWGPALVHLAPLLVAWTLRMFMRRRTIVTRSIA